MELLSNGFLKSFRQPFSQFNQTIDTQTHSTPNVHTFSIHAFTNILFPTSWTIHPYSQKSEEKKRFFCRWWHCLSAFSNYLCVKHTNFMLWPSPAIHRLSLYLPGPPSTFSPPPPHFCFSLIRSYAGSFSLFDLQSQWVRDMGRLILSADFFLLFFSLLSNSTSLPPFLLRKQTHTHTHYTQQRLIETLRFARSNCVCVCWIRNQTYLLQEQQQQQKQKQRFRIAKNKTKKVKTEEKKHTASTDTHTHTNCRNQVLYESNE